MLYAGWPKETIVKKSKEHILAGALTAVGSYLLPIILSCGVYSALICRKNRFLKSRVGVQVIEPQVIGNPDVESTSKSLQDQLNLNEAESQVEHSGSHSAPAGKDSPRRFPESGGRQGGEPERSEVARGDEKIVAQVLAAKRSLVTNLGMIVVIGVVDVVMAMPVVPKDFYPFFTVVVFTTLKAAQPIVTTVANFAPIINLLSQYWSDLISYCDIF